MKIIDVFFNAFEKYNIFRQPLKIFVSTKIMFFGKNLSTVFVISSSPDNFFVCNLEIIFCTIPGVVKTMNLVMIVFLISRTVKFISGKSNPVLDENWRLRIAMRSSVFSLSEKNSPFGSTNGPFVEHYLFPDISFHDFVGIIMNCNIPNQRPFLNVINKKVSI